MASRLKTNPTIARLAADLNLRGSGDPIAAIVRACRKKIHAFVEEFPCATLDELLNVAAAKLDTVFIEIHDDEQLHAVEREYVERRELAFAGLAEQLGPEVYAITFGLNNRRPFDRRFVSLIDCRGAKRHRAYFSKWHELAHLLTLTPQMRLRFCRTHAEPSHKDPEEALMDVIAGDVGFYSPIVAHHAHGRLSFDRIEALRPQLCADASRQASEIGFVKAWPRPTMLVHARLGTRKGDQQPGFGFHTPASMALRAVKVTPNEAARAKELLLPSNMRVPERSVIYQAFTTRNSFGPTPENLSWWESKGVGRPTKDVFVEARAGGDCVDALIVL